jgi:hypothetical protein
MVQISLVGIGAGAAAALLFASVASGSPLSIVLFYLAALPILIAAIGWSHWSALIAALTAAAGLAFFLTPFFFIAFLIGVGLPAWWLGYLALLARTEADGTVEWYPAGRLVVWAAVLGALVVVAAIANFGFDEESFRSGLRRSFERMLRSQTRTPADSPIEIRGMDAKGVVDLLVAVIPLAAAVLATITNSANLWLAARIVSVSGRLRRPWPDLPSMQFPPMTTALLAAMLAGSFLSGLVGTIAGILSAGLLMAFGLLGLAVLHALTRGKSARAFILGGTYAAILVFGWPILLFALLGIAESAFNIRGRFSGPAAPTQRIR